MPAVSLATATAATTLFAIAGVAGPASAATSSGCPSSKTVGSLPTDSKVQATFSTSNKTTTYMFSSLTNENPVGGVPGLIKYCVYPTTPSALPTAHTVTATTTKLWVYATGSNNFAFVRPGGDKSDIPLDGTTNIPMGTATWSAVPQTQTIILHINDPTVCQQLFPGSTTGTCFVKPSAGPICNAGDTNVAYNAMPFDVVDCLNPAIGFEATTASEFGNEVNLAGTARNLDSLKVDFQDFACGTSGHWSGTTQDLANQPSPCVTAPGATFTWPITANIYDPSNLTTPIATTTIIQTIPFRPSADATGHCTGAVGTTNGSNKWWNPNAVGGGKCQNSIGVVLTFNGFTPPGGGPAPTLPDTVVWTVAFSTTHYGNPPVGENTTCFMSVQANDQNPGCPYDSLNVGDNGNTGGANFLDSAISGAPYAGSDATPGAAFVNYADGSFYCSGGAGGSLRLDAGCWDGLRPLGEIITN
jgi:hypothetical protein